MTSYKERLHLKLTVRQLFDLVADVGRYPEFVPWVVAVEIHRHEGQSLWVDMTIGTRLLRRKFSTVAHLDRPHRIDISSTDVLFEHFEQRSTFEPVSDSGSIVEYRLDLKFQSRLLQMLIGGSFADRAPAMVAAFRRRACELYPATRAKRQT